VIRSLPKKISKAPSQKQPDNRKKMTACQEWLMHVTPFVRIGFKIIQQNSMALGMLYPASN